MGNLHCLLEPQVRVGQIVNVMAPCFGTASPASRQVARPLMRATAWLLFLGPFFFLSYGAANNWSAALLNVGAIRFDWERHIPFIGWTIFPYMSIDVFYAASLYICTTRRELDRHALRLMVVTTISVVAYFLFPLRCELVRPATAGITGTLFALLAGLDKPFNQAPSLHIGLLVILWVTYARHLRGATRWLLHGWFALIAISVFTTFQHHALDGLTGLVTGLVGLYLIQDRSWRRRAAAWTDRRRSRLAALYLGAGVACATCTALAWHASGWAWLLAWPATSLLLVGTAYAGMGHDIFQRQDGMQSLAARWLLMPYRCGAWLSSRWLTRHTPASAQVVAGLWIGRAPGRTDWTHLDAAAVLDLTAEFNASQAARRRHYHCVPMLDLVAPSAATLRHAVNALDCAWTQPPVLVHCALGYSRSALVVAAWLLRHGHAVSPQQAIALVRAARPGVVLSEAHLQRLEAFVHGH